MAPNKFEEGIKEKLEQRTIQPSVDAWVKLENSLGKIEKRHKNKTLFWVGLAASIVGIVFVVSQFFNDISVEKNTPVLVVTPESNSQYNNTKVVVDESNLKETINGTVPPVSEIQTTKVSAKTLPQTENKQEEFVTTTKDVAVGGNDRIQNKEVQSIALQTQNLSFEEQKIQEVIAAVDILKDTDKTISDADLEALLVKAQKEILLEKLNRENSGIVDARSLLRDVETDLDRTFRDKVFEALKANFNFVKTAVAQRNN